MRKAIQCSCVPLSLSAASALRLICFPYAGGSASVFQRWCVDLPRWVDLYGIELPGRGRRRAEPPPGDFAAIVREIAGDLDPLLDRPLVFFGHSLGAIISFEVARHLRRSRGVVPAHLFVAARRAPHLRKEALPISRGDDAELLRTIAGLGGTPPDVLQDPDLLRLVLPLVRADFHLAEAYRYRPGDSLACPITVFGGAEDDESSGAKLEAWQCHTSGNFRLHMLPGNHFFIHSSRETLLTLMRRELVSVASGTAPASTGVFL